MRAANPLLFVDIAARLHVAPNNLEILHCGKAREAGEEGRSGIKVRYM